MICYFNFAESSVVSRSATIVWDFPIMFEAPFTEALAGQASEELQRLQTVTRFFFRFFSWGDEMPLVARKQHVKKNMERINTLSETYIGPRNVSWETSIFWTAELSPQKMGKTRPRRRRLKDPV